MCYSVLIEKDMDKISDRFGAIPDAAAFARFALQTKIDSKRFKPIAEHSRIYPGYYAPIILIEKNRKVIRPMRYRLRPHWARKEIPARYNTFNARLDSLETRRSWKPLFMKRHGLLVFEKFYEWVTDEETGKKKVISFQPEGRDTMWAPVIWDRWSDEDEAMESFAIITTDPPPEISMMGHDRCPIFLKESLIDRWLRPEGFSKDEIYETLQSLEPVRFRWLEAA